MGPRRLTNEDSPRRQAILEAALELFAERGFHGTTVPDVAERAGVGAGTLYRYFASKEALVNALFQHWKREYGRFLLVDFPQTESYQAWFHEIWRRMGEFATRHPSVLKFMELHHHSDYLDEESKAVERSVLEPLKLFVMQAQERGGLRPGTPEVLIALAYGAFGGLIRAAFLGFLTLSPAILDEAEQALWAAVRG